MSDKVIQNCYTNHTVRVGDRLSSGWQSVATSPDIPADVLSACERFQAVNSSIPKEMLDEYGNTLNLFEICSNNSHVFVMRSQYGFKDIGGRRNMFCHAFGFSWKDEAVLADPNELLTLDNGNFRTNAEDAAHIPENLARTAPWTIADAMERSGMDTERYTGLIRCAYTQLTAGNTTRPLYIQYDGTEEQMKALLYCLYAGLPFHLRKKLQVASAPIDNRTDKNIIFTINAAARPYYFLPATGENNILTDRILDKYARFGFMDHAPLHLPGIDMTAYFRQLDNMASALSAGAATDELILQLAYRLMYNGDVSAYDDTMLEISLSDALRSNSAGSEPMDRYIALMIQETQDRGKFLLEQSEENLTMRLGTSTEPSLKAVAEQYNIHRLASLPPETAAQKLHKFTPDIFLQYANILCDTDTGTEILDIYYSKAVLTPPITWERLHTQLRESIFLSRRPKTLKAIYNAAGQLYDASAQTQGAVTEAFEAYRDLLLQLLTPEKAEDICRSRREEYWENLSFRHLNGRYLAEYKFMQTDSPRCAMFCDFINLQSSVSQKNETELVNAIYEYFQKYGDGINGADRQAANTMLHGAVTERYTGTDRWFGSWVLLLLETMNRMDLCQHIWQIRNAVAGRKMEGLADLLFRLPDLLPDGKTTERICTIVREFCQACEETDKIVPLDVWLALGCLQYENPFTILDMMNPGILDEENAGYVQSSRYLDTPECVQMAKSYIELRGASAKVVKKWLSERKAAEKRRSGDDDAGSLFGNMLQTVKNKFTQSARPAEEPTAPPAPRPAPPQRNQPPAKPASTRPPQSKGASAKPQNGSLHPPYNKPKPKK